MLRAEVKLQQGQSVNDLDDPLDVSAQESLEEEILLRPASAHVPQLLGRVWREIQRGSTLTVIAIDKVKSFFAVNRPKNDKFIDLGSAKLQLRQEDTRAAQSVAEYYQRLRVLSNAYSVAGTFQVESKMSAGTKVLMARPSTLLNYCDAVFEACDGITSWD